MATLYQLAGSMSPLRVHVPSGATSVQTTSMEGTTMVCGLCCRTVQKTASATSQCQLVTLILTKVSRLCRPAPCLHRLRQLPHQQPTTSLRSPCPPPPTVLDPLAERTEELSACTTTGTMVSTQVVPWYTTALPIRSPIAETCATRCTQALTPVVPSASTSALLSNANCTYRVGVVEDQSTGERPPSSSSGTLATAGRSVAMHHVVST